MGRIRRRRLAVRGGRGRETLNSENVRLSGTKRTGRFENSFTVELESVSPIAISAANSIAVGVVETPCVVDVAANRIRYRNRIRSVPRECCVRTLNIREARIPCGEFKGVARLPTVVVRAKVQY